MRGNPHPYQGIRTVTGRVIVEADGGSRGNPGPAGFGAVVLAPDKTTVLAERFEAIGIATNNVAEYRGLLAGLAAAAEIGADEVDVRMDSKLVVEQMSGRWQVKHPDMIDLAEQARRLANRFARVTYTWIPRAQNAHADRLANRAMDAAEDGPLDDTAPVPAANTAPGWTGALGEPTRLLLVRHGQTELSVDRRYSGRGNPALTELGRSQAERAAKRVAGKGFDVAAVLSSPLDRALATASAVGVGLGIDPTVVDGLTETDFGDWEGLTFSEAAERDPELHRRWLTDTSVHPPMGESFEEVRGRIETVRDHLVTEYPGRTVVVVSHVTPIKTLLQIALGVGSSLLYRLHLDLASLSIVEFYPDGGASVRLVNDTAHLD
ncbi:bifunctional RNase H/acid phosphatase [Antrihabitans sp. YC3-6]|uniref:Bifunctional RNase H/acid phosphatase n=1 Tax=Antrihabitans stalagmiti TaxID=2799499 RepID=A0A934NV87_9NOCA|nr:bifunctional RNase H/acid phosphatase [Antrihabitans stalagmiti]MBJ8341827.1 bifunctional RNase H/acid phosphatase [Antrihabitans stalagmiti]